MAHFRGTVQGGRGECSRLGTKNSGLTTTANGWNIGGEVTVIYDEALGCDVVSLRITSGSGGKFGSKLLGRFKIEDGEFVKI